MTYRSKKDATVTAVVDFEDTKYKTLMMIYMSGPDKGKSFNITEATLNRYWEPVEKSSNEILNVDLDIVNTPYPEPKVQKYIPKPKSVIEYEEKKKRVKYEVPSYEELCEIFAPAAKKINSSYMRLKDEVAIKVQNGGMRLNVPENYMEVFSELGLVGKENKDTLRPLYYIVKDMETFNKVKEILLENNK